MGPLGVTMLLFAVIIIESGIAYYPPESRPPEACGINQATCPNKACIYKNRICDGNYDCPDGSDEQNCNHKCRPKEFRCRNGKCIAKCWRCDSENDCDDNSDEINCTNSASSPCEDHEFTCLHDHQCIPKSYHCDGFRDCNDKSDEASCSPASIVHPPSPLVKLRTGKTLELTCRANGEPPPEIVWRLNLGPVPKKCKTTSESTSRSSSFGKLICPDIQEWDQGAYLCEGIAVNGSVFSDMDTILLTEKNVCPGGFLNKETDKCVSCFCSNRTTECNSADLFKFHLTPSFDSYKVIAVRKDFSISGDPIYNLLVSSAYEGGIQARVDQEILPYLAMPANFKGNQLSSYGGYIKFRLVFKKHLGYLTLTPFPMVILKGNRYTLHSLQKNPQATTKANVSIGLFEGEWSNFEEGRPATRQDIMMVLTSVTDFLIKLQYSDEFLDTRITDIEMDSATPSNAGLGRMSSVEQCKCPLEYSRLSCETRSWV